MKCWKYYIIILGLMYVYSVWYIYTKNLWWMYEHYWLAFGQLFYSTRVLRLSSIYSVLTCTLLMSYSCILVTPQLCVRDRIGVVSWPGKAFNVSKVPVRWLLIPLLCKKTRPTLTLFWIVLFVNCIEALYNQFIIWKMLWQQIWQK